MSANVAEVAPPIVGAEEQSLEAPQSPKQSINSEALVENTKEDTSPSPSVKSGQGVENIESNSPKLSIKSGQDVDKKYAMSTTKSGQSFEVKNSSNSNENPTIKQEPQTPPSEENSSTKNSQVLENVEAVNSPNVDENATIKQEPQPPLEDGALPEEASQQDKESLKAPQGSEVKKVSFSTYIGTKLSERPFQGGFISNKDVKLPSVKDDPSLEKGYSGDLQTQNDPSFRPPATASPPPQPWMYAVFVIFCLTTIMRFFMNNFRFISVLLYSIMVSLLVLRCFGHGPFAVRRRN